MLPFFLRFVAIAFFFFTHFCDGQQPNIEEILDDIGNSVQDIANQAVVNQENTCGSLSNCTLQTCVRRACWPQSKDEANSLSCISFPSNPGCHSSSNATCNSLRVSTKSSYIRLSPLASTSDPAVQTAMCAQKPLDPTLQEGWKTISKYSQGFSFFGGVEGYLYIFPGRDSVDDSGCSSYDPRKRSWYIHALWVQKSLYILLDTSISMSTSIGPLSSQTRLEVAKNIISELLNTLSHEDYVAVSTLAGGTIGEPVTVLFENIKTSENNTGIQAIKNALSMTNFDNSTADIKKALAGALKLSASLNIILLLTDGAFASNINFTDLAPLFQQLNEKNVIVFVYRLGFYTANDETFQRMKTNLNMTFEIVKDETNPLLKVRSYFDYIAWLRFLAVEKKPTWAPVYSDVSGLGNVTTSIYPAFDTNRRLIGVASIDIATEFLKSRFGFSTVEEALANRSPEPSREKPLPLNQTVLNDASSGCQKTGQLTPICPRQDFSTPMETFICCENCSEPKDKKSRSKLLIPAIAGGTSAVVIGALVVGIAVYFACFRAPRKIPEPVSPQPNDWLIPSRSR